MVPLFKDENNMMFYHFSYVGYKLYFLHFYSNGIL